MTLPDAISDLDAPPAASRNRGPTFPALLVAIAAFLAMGRLLACGFTNWDDPHTITENPGILHPSFGSLEQVWTTPLAELYIPVPYTIWWSLSALIGDRSTEPVSLNPH